MKGGGGRSEVPHVSFWGCKKIGPLQRKKRHNALLVVR